MVTIIADNYYGYCKKEVKTQISYAANLYGMCEEEHAGGAIAFPAYVLGQEFHAGRTVLDQEGHVRRSHALLGDRVEPSPRATRSIAAIPNFLRSGKCRIQRPRRLGAMAARTAARTG